MATGLVFAYEEALGHCVDPESVRDKDGISAAVARRRARWRPGSRPAGRTLLDALDDLAVAHGVHVTDQVSVRVDGPVPRSARLMARLRAEPPSTLAGAPVTAEDLLPRADGVRWSATACAWSIRPSGTEPKVKAYLQTWRRVPGPEALAEARAAARSGLLSCTGRSRPCSPD